MEEDNSSIEALEQIVINIRDQMCNYRSPLVIEFAGTPKAGKTTTIDAISKFLRRNNIHTTVIKEQAQDCPIVDKKNPEFNIWTGISTLTQVINVLQQKENIIFVDRGIFDSLVWMDFHQNRNTLSTLEFHSIESFFLLERWRKNLVLIIILSVDPVVSLERDSKDVFRETAGSIMNSGVLKQFNLSLTKCKANYCANFQRIVSVDTTSMKPFEGVCKVTRVVLDSITDILKS